MNSWRMTLADVPTAEMLEVQLVNSVAPFILCSKLKNLMLFCHPTEVKHVVNVSAMEWQVLAGIPRRTNIPTPTWRRPRSP